MKLIEIGYFMISRSIELKKSSKHFGKWVLWFWWKNQPKFKIYLWKAKV